jgi:serine protease
VRLLADRAAPPEPALALETPAVRIGEDESVARVPFRNAAGGTLVLHALTVATDAGIPWLAAAVERDALRLSADRSALGPGEHTGRVHVTSNGGVAELGVVLSVSPGPPEDVGPVTIHLRRADDATVVASATAVAAAGYAYRFDDVPPGRYEIVATTDRDADGAFCDVGELCGAYPDRLAPLAVGVFGGSVVTARDFGIALIVSNADAVP